MASDFPDPVRDGHRIVPAVVPDQGILCDFKCRNLFLHRFIPGRFFLRRVFRIRIRLGRVILQPLAGLVFSRGSFAAGGFCFIAFRRFVFRCLQRRPACRGQHPQGKRRSRGAGDVDQPAAVLLKMNAREDRTGTVRYGFRFFAAFRVRSK